MPEQLFAQLVVQFVVQLVLQLVVQPDEHLPQQQLLQVLPPALSQLVAGNSGSEKNSSHTDSANSSQGGIAHRP